MVWLWEIQLLIHLYAHFCIYQKSALSIQAHYSQSIWASVFIFAIQILQIMYTNQDVDHDFINEPCHEKTCLRGLQPE